MNLLFVHQNFPGQFKHLAPALAARGHRVEALGLQERAPMPGVRYWRYGLPRRSKPQGLHPWAVDFDTKLWRAEACARAALALRQRGFVPDAIGVHPAWGEAMFLREVWPRAPQLHYVEYFYGAVGQDSGFDPEFGPVSDADAWRLRAKNTHLTLALQDMDQGICPTHWQANTIPPAWREKISVIHDGVDTAALLPEAGAQVTLLDDLGRQVTLGRDEPVVTFVARNLEPYRGYHQLIRALPELQRLSPKARIVIVGGDKVSYGAAAPTGTTWKAHFWNEVADSVDTTRVHFVGQLPYQVLVRLLQLSSAHIYLTYPFVLSWSLLEAMSVGALVVASDTAPVREVISDGRNGFLVDFFEPAALARRVADALKHRAQLAAMRTEARRTIVERFDLRTVCLPAQMALLERVARG